MDQDLDVPSPNTQFPNPSGYGGDETYNGAYVTTPTFLPPQSPYLEIPATYQPIGTQNFNPGAVVSFVEPVSEPLPDFPLEMFLPQASPSPPSSFRNSPAPPSRVGNYTLGLPPRPPVWGNSVRGSASGQPPRETHRQTNSVAMSELNLAQNSPPELIYPKPVGETDFVLGEDDQSDGDTTMPMDMDEINAYLSSDSDGNKRKRSRAGIDVSPSSRHIPSVSLGDRLDGNVTPPLDPKDQLTASEMQQIMGCEKLSQIAQTDLKKARRILSNRQSAARSKERKANYLVYLETRVKTLEADSYANSLHTRHLVSEKLEKEIENKELKVRLQGSRKEARLSNSLVKQLRGEVRRLKELLFGGVSYNGAESSSGPQMQPLNPNMYQNLDTTNQFHQPQMDPDHFQPTDDASKGS